MRLPWAQCNHGAVGGAAAARRPASQRDAGRALLHRDEALQPKTDNSSLQWLQHQRHVSHHQACKLNLLAKYVQFAVGDKVLLDTSLRPSLRTRRSPRSVERESAQHTRNVARLPRVQRPTSAPVPPMT